MHWLSVGIALALATPASADMIETSNSGTFGGVDYGYDFSIEDNVDPLLFHATLENTSPDSGPLISLLAFNILGQPALGTDFFIENITPNWIFSPAGMGVEFHYLGQTSAPEERLMRFESLTFDIRFATGPANLNLFLDAPTSSGAGIGGDNDEGQVAVFFEQLGEAGVGSDLLASNWSRVSQTTEPSALVLLGTGLLGIASLLRRRRRP